MYTHRLHAWYIIYLHLDDFVRANVNKYSIHGAYGIGISDITSIPDVLFFLTTASTVDQGGLG